MFLICILLKIVIFGDISNINFRPKTTWHWVTDIGTYNSKSFRENSPKFCVMTKNWSMNRYAKFRVDTYNATDIIHVIQEKPRGFGSDPPIPPPRRLRVKIYGSVTSLIWKTKPSCGYSFNFWKMCEFSLLGYLSHTILEFGQTALLNSLRLNRAFGVGVAYFPLQINDHFKDFFLISASVKCRNGL